MDTDQTSDSTLEPEFSIERHHASFSVSPVIDNYLLQLTDTAKKGKRGRPRKTKSPKENSGNKPSVRVTTRSDDDKDNKSFTPYVSNRQKKENNLQSPRGSENECIQTRVKNGISKVYKS